MRDLQPSLEGSGTQKAAGDWTECFMYAVFPKRTEPVCSFGLLSLANSYMFLFVTIETTAHIT